MVAVGEFPGVTFACVGRLHLPAAQQIGSFSVYFFPNFSDEQEFWSSHLWLLYFNPSFCQYAHFVKSNQLDIVIKWEELFISWWHCWLTSHKDGYSISSSSHQLICLSYQIMFQPPKGSKKAKKSGSNIFSLFSQKQIQEFKEAFGIIDNDKDGIITAPDLKKAFEVSAHFRVTTRKWCITIALGFLFMKSMVL